MKDLQHFLGHFGASRRWLDAHELGLGCLVNHEHSIAFLSRIPHGVHRPLLRVDHLSRVLLLGEAAPFGIAHGVLFLLRYRGRQRKLHRRASCRRCLSMAVVSLEELPLLYGVHEAVGVVLPQNLFLLLSHLSVVEQPVDDLVILVDLVGFFPLAGLLPVRLD